MLLSLNLLLQTQSPSSQASNPLVGFVPILIIFAIFYFLLFMPMQRQKRKTQKMLKDLQNGQIVLTNGGIIGTITEMKDDDTLVLRVKPDGVKLQVARSAVSTLISGEVKK